MKKIYIICLTLVTFLLFHINVKAFSATSNFIFPYILNPFNNLYSILENSAVREKLNLNKDDNEIIEIIEIESTDSNLIQVKLNKEVMLSNIQFSILNTDGEVIEVINNNKIKQEKAEFYLQTFQHLKSNEQYVLEVLEKSTNTITQSHFNPVHNINYYQFDYKVLGDNLVEITLNNNIRTIGYLVPDNFDGYINFHEKNKIYIKTEEKLKKNKVYSFTIRFSKNIYGLNIDKIYGFFKYEPDNRPIMVKNVNISDSYTIKMEINKRLLEQNIDESITEYISLKQINDENISDISVKSLSIINDNELLITTNEKLKNGQYTVSLKNLLDSFNQPIEIEDYHLSVSLIDDNQYDYPKVTKIHVLSDNVIRVFYNKNLSKYYAEQITNYQLFNLNDYTKSYKVYDVKYNYKDKYLDLYTNIDVPNQKFLLTIDSMKDIYGMQTTKVSHKFTSSTKVNFISINSANITFVNNVSHLKNGYYLKVTFNNLDKKYNQEDLILSYNNKNIEIQPKFINGILYFPINENLFGKTVYLSTHKDSKTIYPHHQKIKIPTFKEQMDVQSHLYYLSNSHILELKFSQPVKVDSLQNIILKNGKDNKNIEYKIKTNEKLSEKVYIELAEDNKINTLKVEFPQDKVQSFLNEPVNIKKHEVSAETPEIDNFIEKIYIVQPNLIRLVLEENVLLDNSKIEKINQQIGIIDSVSKKFINIDVVKQKGNYVDIYIKDELKGVLYYLSIENNLFYFENNKEFVSPKSTIHMQGYDLQNDMVLSVNKEWLSSNFVNEIIISYEGNKQYSIYGENKTTEPGSEIFLYTKKGKLIGKTTSKEDGSFDKIVIPHEYKKYKEFLLENIDLQGNIKRIEIFL